jgi:hypothetical protein
MIRIFFILLLVSNTAFAGNVQGTGIIKNVYFHSKDSVLAASWKGMLQLELNSLSWNVSTDCNTQYVAVREKDTHIVSAILAAKMSNKPITVYANDTIKASGSFCFLRAVGI